jgi:hypothetical protein
MSENTIWVLYEVDEELEGAKNRDVDKAMAAVKAFLDRYVLVCCTTSRRY